MSGTDNTQIIYWDSCIYLAWLLNEQQHGQDVSNAIRQILQANFQRKNIIISSTISFTEVLSTLIGDENEKSFRKSFRNQDHIAYDVDPPIALKARHLRENVSNTGSGRKLATPDAIHLATAMIYQAKEFMTLDDKLLRLNGEPLMEGMKICKPCVAQPEFGLATTSPAIPASSPPPPRPSPNP